MVCSSTLEKVIFRSPRLTRALASALLVLALLPASPAGEPELDQRVVSTATSIESLSVAIDAFKLDRGSVPGPTEGLVDAEFLRAFLEPDYIRLLPLEDGWGNAFRYISNGSSFAILSCGQDGIPDRAYDAPLVSAYADGGDDLLVVDDRMAAVPLELRQMIRTGEQKRTMSDMRSIAISIESYKIDNELVPGPTPGQVEIAWIREQVEPVYIRTLPQQDAWGMSFLYWSDGQHYRIVSLGLDRAQDRPFTEIEHGTGTQSFSSDIVFEDGEFKQFPEGEQH